MLKKIMSVLLAACFTLPLTACGTNKEQKINLPEGNGVEKIMTGGWYSPKVEEEQFKMIADSGLNMIFLQGGNIGDKCDDVELIKKALSYCDKYGLDAYVQKGNNKVSFDYAYQYEEIYKTYKSFKGYLVFDEPHPGEEMESLISNVTEYQKHVDGEFFVNLFPSYFSADVNYEEYLESYANGVLDKLDSQKWLSIDYYPLTYDAKGNKTLASSWLSDIETAANVAKEHSSKTHFFIQTMPFSSNGTAAGSRDRIPTLADIRLQVYTYLAFGASGFTHFCYATPSVGIEFNEQQLAMVDRNGNKTQLYDSAKCVNEEIQTFESMYTGFEWQGIYPLVGSESNTSRVDAINQIRTPLDLLDLYEIKDISATQDILVGSFLNKDGVSAYVIVNFGETTKNLATDVNIAFKKADYVREYKSGKTSDKNAKNGYTLHLEAGEGAFIIPYNK